MVITETVEFDARDRSRMSGLLRRYVADAVSVLAGMVLVMMLQSMMSAYPQPSASRNGAATIPSSSLPPSSSSSSWTAPAAPVCTLQRTYSGLDGRQHFSSASVQFSPILHPQGHLAGRCYCPIEQPSCQCTPSIGTDMIAIIMRQRPASRDLPYVTHATVKADRSDRNASASTLRDATLSAPLRRAAHRIDPATSQFLGILAVDRKHPPMGRSLIGGFIDPGESASAAAYREWREETALECFEPRFMYAVGV